MTHKKRCIPGVIQIVSTTIIALLHSLDEKCHAVCRGPWHVYFISTVIAAYTMHHDSRRLSGFIIDRRVTVHCVALDILRLRRGLCYEMLLWILETYTHSFILRWTRTPHWNKCFSFFVLLNLKNISQRCSINIH